MAGNFRENRTTIAILSFTLVVNLYHICSSLHGNRNKTTAYD